MKINDICLITMNDLSGSEPHANNGLDVSVPDVYAIIVSLR